MAENEEQPLADQKDEMFEWRRSSFEEMGFSSATARKLAEKGLSPANARELLDRGCPLHLVVEILR